ncbi:MAG: hypothetical protein ACK2UO_01495 [Caldilineaceae bacterium]
MQNLQGTGIWIVAGVAFVLGFLIQWLIARSRKNALVHDYERQVQSAQRESKRMQDDLDTVRGQLEAQRERAEVLAAERANAQSDLQLAVEASSGTEEKLAELESALEQEVERREAAEGLLEQIRTQAMDLQTALDAARSDLTDRAARLDDEAEARSAAETALAAETLRVSLLAQELETLSGDLATARTEIEAAVALQQAPVHTEEAIESTDEIDVTLATDSEMDSQQPSEQEVPVEQPPVGHADRDDTALAMAQRRVAELNDSVTALSAMGAELALEFEKRERENERLRAQLAAHGIAEPNGDLPDYGEVYDSEPDVATLKAQLSTALAHSVELEHQLSFLQAGAERLSTASQPGGQAPASEVVVDAEEYQRMTADIAQAAARVAELEGQLEEETQSAAAIGAKLSDADSQMQRLTAAMDELRQDRDALADKVSAMQSRLDERTEEVSALTSATVAAAATLKRREDALRQSEALIESLRAQILEAEEENASVAAALEEKNAQVSNTAAKLDAMQTELASLAQEKAALEEKLAASTTVRRVQGRTVQTGLPAIDSEGENSASLPVSQFEQTGDEAPSGQALDAKNEDAVPFSVKEAAISSALSAGVTTGELEAPQDLLRLPGIGPRYQSMLYAAGIGTFWEFASCSDKVILAALELDDTDRMRAKASEARSEARKLASETGTVGMLWSRA